MCSLIDGRIDPSISNGQDQRDSISGFDFYLDVALALIDDCVLTTF